MTGGTRGTFLPSKALFLVRNGASPGAPETCVPMTSLENAAEPEAWFKLEGDGKKLAVGGAWTIAESARLDRELAALKLPERGPLTIDASKISRLDSAGAWLLIRTRRALKTAGEKDADLHLP